MKVASIAQVREIERAADRSLLSFQQMMLNAGAEASELLQQRIPIDAASKITFLIGKGNNGGDGLVMARELARTTRADPQLYLLGARDHADLNYRAVLDAGLSLASAADDHNGKQLSNLVESADIIVDAILGIGARLPLRGPAAKTLETVNDCLRKRKTRPFVLAIDCPSGIDCDTGDADANVIAADLTISFIAGKPGLFVFPAARYVGDLEIATIGIPERFPQLARIKTTAFNARIASSLLPERPLDGHKGSFGKVLLVAGSEHYIGAIALAAEAAYRSGAGLVTVATTRRLIETVAGSLREPTWLPLAERDGGIAETALDAVLAAAEACDALLIGCGLGTRESTREFQRRLFARGSLPALVLDADALNLLQRDARWWDALPPGTIITPHPGELARLTDLSANEVNADRWDVARQCADRWNLVLVLKGAHTLIAAPDGRTCVLPIKTDALSTAGTGDILAGLITGLRAQGLNAFDSARLGACIHASAGVIAAQNAGSSRSVIAGDVLSALGSSFAALERL